MYNCDVALLCYLPTAIINVLRPPGKTARIKQLSFIHTIPFFVGVGTVKNNLAIAIINLQCIIF